LKADLSAFFAAQVRRLNVTLTGKHKLVFLALIISAAAFRIAVVHWLPNDSAGDSIGYEQIARNVLEQHVYTHIDEAPFTPTDVRLPGYPLFLAAIYSVFGHTNNTAVRVAQALVDTGTCVLVALLAWLWQPDEQKKMATAIAAMALAAVNPFTTIYCATILTEVPSTFLIVAACIAATLAFRADKIERELRWWAVSGLITGVAVLFRPDVGLVAASIGVLAIVKVFRQDARRWRKTILAGAVLSAAFLLALAPWTIRNWRVLHVFQPLAPLNANMPGEFVPLGYQGWLKTWMTDGEFLDELMWNLGKEPVDIGDLPDGAFDSQAEHERVEALFDKLNGWDTESSSPTQRAKPSSSPSLASNKGQPKSGGEPDDEEADVDEQATQANDQSKTGDITPDIDAGFGQIAKERIARRPFRYYVLLPLQRAHALWFNTHSDFYPFNGDALPLNSPENTRAENFWLPVFAVLVGIYTVLGVGGLFLLTMNGVFNERAWVLLVVLIFATRLALFSMAVSVEPRYVVEFFPILAVTGGIAILNFRDFFKRSVPSE
jgi:4-amino-4-deoxy-L-arabinose transferase-like glycosyltransferase